MSMWRWQCGFLLALAGASSAAGALTVAVDVGHFPGQPGAASARGRAEYDFNRELALEIERSLERRGLGVVLIGADGSMKRLADRVRAARGADLLLSVHHDSVQPRYLESWIHEGAERVFSDRFSGFSLFVSRRNPRLAASLACASSVGAALRSSGFHPSLYHAEPIPGEMKSFADRENGVHYYDNLVVLKDAASPAVLLEAGVIVNRAEELELAAPATRARIAEAVADGLARCLEKNRRR